jgi:hypothetical protein
MFKKKKPNNLMSLWEPESNTETPETTPTADFSHIPPSLHPVREVASTEDTNESGLKRAKKGITLGKKKVYQMEVKIIILRIF